MEALQFVTSIQLTIVLLLRMFFSWGGRSGLKGDNPELPSSTVYCYVASFLGGEKVLLGGGGGEYPPFPIPPPPPV